MPAFAGMTAWWFQMSLARRHSSARGNPQPFEKPSANKLEFKFTHHLKFFGTMICIAH